MAASLPTPFSYQQFTGDGSKTDFTFSFDYLLREHVKVYLDDTEVAEGSAANEFQWENDKAIKMGTAPTAAQTLTIIRLTPEDKQQVPWNDGSYLIAEDLNTSDLQWLYLLEEHHDYIIRIIWGLPPVPGPGLPDDLFGLWNRLARNKDSNKGTADEIAQTIDKTDQLKGDAVPGSVQNGEDAYVLTLGAISERLDLVKGDGSSYPGAGNVGQLGKLRVNSSNKLFFWDQTLATPAWVEIIGGSAGPPGAAATIEVGTTTTLSAGSSATVTNVGTSSAAKFNFGIPKGADGTNGTDGAKGDKGDKGDTGPAPGLQSPATVVSNVANKPDGSVGDATVSIEQDATSKDLKFTFGIPVGEKGPKGDKGADGTGAGTVTEVKGGPGIASDGSSSTPKVSVDLATNPGLEFTGSGDDQKLKAKVKSTGGITLDADGLSVTTPFSEPPDDNKTYGRKTNSGTSSWVEVSGGTGTVTGVSGGSGITVDSSTAATPKVAVDYGDGLEASGAGDSAKAQVKLDGNTITRGAAGIKVTTPFSEPGSNGDFVRRRAAGPTFSWVAAPAAGVPEPTSDGTFSRKKDGASLSWVAAEGFADVSTDGSFVRTRSSGTNSWTAAPWTVDGTTIKPATATNDVETTAALKTKQVYADAVTLTGATVTPDFKDGNCFILSGAITTVNAPTPGTLKVGQTGKFYFLSGATVDGWNTNYKWPGGTKALAPTGVTIVPFYVATTSIILMGASTEDIK